MDWTQRLMAVIDYIEDHLTDRIDEAKICKIACCSYYNLQRTFSFIFNMPLATYIRNRRLTLAAAEMTNGQVRILDIAIKYQYESQESFSRAFQKFHGIPPSAAKRFPHRLACCPKGTIDCRERRVVSMSQGNALLARKQPEQLFYKGVKGPGTLRVAMSAWSFLEFTGQSNHPQQAYTILASLCGELYQPAVSLPSKDDVQTMFQTLGYPCQVYTARACGGLDYLSKDAMENLVVSAISQTQRPVIVCNRLDDWCFGGAVMGYEGNGRTLINWGYFPFDDSANPQPILTKSANWYHDSTLLAIPGQRDVPAELGAVYKAGVQGAYAYLSNGQGMRNALFYQNWRRILSQPLEQTFREASGSRVIPCTWTPLRAEDCNQAGITEKLMEVIDPLWCDYAERRFYAARFMQQAMEFLPRAKEPLNQARAAFDQIHQMMFQYIAKVGLVPGAAQFDREKFFHPQIRTELVQIVDRCQEEEQRAVLALSRARANL